ncbi:unnamed protein product [Brassica rapa]|uniref:Uncharacterized protein n=2 Tax=Brassica TaxID=3705 RepID=A0A3P6AGF9_BRACM|nr:unnamed protein product [Brassica napus]CAG7894750.1 unnamed protein product [Brassica rapa]CDY48789.1 BnaA02g24300D [Brassica napus]VDC90777.1 unnamed protein product [Brassica rapa]
MNPKRLGGNLTVSSVSSPHVFKDYDVQPTIDYFNWLVLGSNPEIEKLVNAEEVTKAEIVTAGKIYAYIKKKFAREGRSNAYLDLGAGPAGHEMHALPEF